MRRRDFNRMALGFGLGSSVIRLLRRKTQLRRLSQQAVPPLRL